MASDGTKTNILNERFDNIVRTALCCIHGCKERLMCTVECHISAVEHRMFNHENPHLNNLAPVSNPAEFSFSLTLSQFCQL